MEFLADIELIAANCLQYNGNDSRLTANARNILVYARSELSEVRLNRSVVILQYILLEISYSFQLIAIS